MAKKKKNKPKNHNDQHLARENGQQAVGQTHHSSMPNNNNDPKGKKRKRSKSEEDDGKKNNDTLIVSIVPYVVQWLEKRKKKVPDALQKEGASFITDIDKVLCLLPSLRERERRALVRHVEKCIINNNNNGKDGESTTNIELQDSDGEYDNIHDTNQNNSVDIKSSGWPVDIKFSNNYQWDPAIPKELKDKYSPPTSRQRSPRLSNRVYFKRISDPHHPAHGEYGLYCALKEGAPPGSWLLDYVGHVTLGENQNKESDYVSDFGERSELACDANTYGNEARFLNDVSTSLSLSLECV